MHICPNCKTEFRHRKDGGCPNCGEPLLIWNGRAYRESLGSPTVALLEHFEGLVSEKTSRIQMKPIGWRLPRKSARYRRELAMAEQLIEGCDGSIELACATLDTLFRNPQFMRRNYTSLMGFFNDFSLALTITQAHLSKMEQADNQQDLYYNQLMQRENIFLR